MKKKFLTLAMAAVMTVASAVTAFADSVTITNKAWWDAWTPGYEVKDGETVEFDIDVKGADRIWDNVNAVFASVATDGKTEPKADNFEGYKEYAVIRADNFGWGDAYATAKFVGGANTDEGLAEADFIAMMKDAHLDVTVSKSGETVTYYYKATGANGSTMERTCTFTADTSAGLYVFFTGDADAAAGTSVTMTVAKVEAEEPSSEAPTTKAEDDTTVAGGEATTAADTETTTQKTTPPTGDASNSVVLFAVAAAAVAGVVVLKKRTVTE